MHSALQTGGAVAVGALLAAAPALAQEIYVLDLKHTMPTFEVTHLGFSQQHGAFSITSGNVTLDRAARKGTIDVTIASASLVTSPALLKMVKSEEFLNVEKFPAMTYKSTDVAVRRRQSGRRQRRIHDARRDPAGGAQGDDVQVRPQSVQQEADVRRRGQPRRFKRSDFGMKAALGAASDDVKISIALRRHEGIDAEDRVAALIVRSGRRAGAGRRSSSHVSPTSAWPKLVCLSRATQVNPAAS